MKTLLKFVLLAAVLVPHAGHAQDYPSKPVTIVIPFPPGGSNDVLGRFLADRLGKLWNQPVIVENRSGGGSSIGSSYVAKSPPDGYRMVLVSSSYTTNAATRTDLPFDPIKDLKPVSMIARGQVAVLTGARVPMATLADLARESKTKTIFYGTAGVGSTQHFYAELLSDAMGIKMTGVPYKGGQEALLDLQGGRIDVVVGSLGGLLGTAATGKGKLIAVLGKSRAAVAPNVPTATESGFKDALAVNYWAMFVPTATPETVAKKIHEGIRAVTHTAEGQQFLAKMDGEPTESSEAEVTAFVKTEIDYWTKLARKLNISATN
jgi:tripartite-type tricarboxylate transporter receptor subunit TctC